MDKEMDMMSKTLTEKIDQLGQKIDQKIDQLDQKIDAQNKDLTKLLKKEIAAATDKQTETIWLLRQEMQEQAQRNFDILERDLNGAMEWAKSLQKQKVDKKALKQAAV